MKKLDEETRTTRCEPFDSNKLAPMDSFYPYKRRGRTGNKAGLAELGGGGGSERVRTELQRGLPGAEWDRCRLLLRLTG